MMRRGRLRFLHLPRSARRIRADVDEELQFDVEMRARELAKDGKSAGAAHDQAVAEFGNLEETRAYCADLDMDHEMDERRTDFLGELRSDARMAWRGMQHAPAFALVVLATLALGIGANTAIFSVVRRVLIAPLPYRAPEQLYRLYTVPATPDGDDDKLSAVELADLAADSRSVAGVTWFGNYGGVTYTDGETAEPWQTAAVAANFFDVLGVRPVVGRAFSDDDVANGGLPVIIISYSLWQRVFSGDPAVVGRKVQLNNTSWTIVGVLPRSFVGPTFTADGLLPLNVPGILRATRFSRSRVWRAVVRLKDGVSVAAFESELGVLRGRAQARYPEIKNAGVIRPMPLHDAEVGRAGPVLLLVMTGASLVLVIMCVNIAGLFLARAAARRRELGIRSALGAGQARLVRQALTETAFYGLTGGAAGVALAFAMKNAFVRMAGPTLPAVGEVRIDGAVLAFAALVSLACGLVFGVLPARAATRVDVRDAIGESSGGGRAASHGRSHIRGARLLVAAQIALAIVLVVGAGLLLRTFVGLMRTDVGYDTGTRVETFRVNLPSPRYPGDAGTSFVHGFLDRVRGLPGVQAAGITNISPWNGPWMIGVRIPDRAFDAGAAPTVEYEIASDGFFEALGISLRAGRSFGPADRTGTPPVVIVSQSVARRFWPGANAVGARVRLDTGGPDSMDVREVIGVVGDVRPSAMEDPVATIYVSAWQYPQYGGEFVVRTAADASTLVPAVKRILHEMDPRLPLLWPRTLHEVLRFSVARQQLAMALMGAFAVLAVVLAALGIYSVMAYSVSSRAREFGVRAALGAQRHSILLLVLRQGLETTLAGALSGLVLAVVAARFIASLLVGVSSHDTLTFAAASVLIVIVAAAACMVPALAATRVQPVDALRVE